ncbi:MAG: hypothetical protein RIS64_737 [Bacteroidota bacterium]|jgi:NTE family protein
MINNHSGQHAQAVHLYRWLPALFGILDDDYLEGLITHKVHWVELHSNEILFQQGEIGDKMFILISGRLQEVRYDKNKQPTLLYEIHQGELAGELAVISGTPHRYAGIAARDCVVAYITRETYFEIAEKFPEHSAYLMNIVIKKLTQPVEPHKQKRERWNIAFVPLTPAVDMAAFMATIKADLMRHGRVLPLSSDLINEYLGYDQIAQVTKNQLDLYQKLSLWIDRYEAQFNFILYQSDFEWSEWTHRCLRQADEIIFVGNAQNSPQCSVLEKQILENCSTGITANQTLVLLHDNKTKYPSGTFQWLTLRPHCTRHQHLKLSNQADCERFARHLSGQTIGLVLSGGAARGIAHVGVVKALREANIAYDIVGGTSFGALVGGAVALNNTFEEMMAMLQDSFHKSPVDLNWLPYMSLVKGEKIDKSLKKEFGEVELSDTWLNLYCVASNISRAKMHLFQTGKIREALRASIALPGIFAPVLLDGDFLIDGGIFDNLPIETMVNHYKPNKIIAVEVGFVEKPKFEHALMPSNLALWRDSFRKDEKRKYKVPTMLGSIVESMMLCSDYKTSQFREKVDLLLRPDLTKFGAGDWKKYKELVQAGYEYTVKALESQTLVS